MKDIFRQLFKRPRLDDRDFDNVCAVGYWRGAHTWTAWGIAYPGSVEMRVCTRCNLYQTRAALEPQP